MIPNALTLAAAAKMPIGELAALSPEELASLHAEADQALRDAKAVSDWMSAAIELRYADAARRQLVVEGRESGTVRIPDQGFIAVAELPKKVTWDQRALRRALDQMGDDEAQHYAKVALSVEERKFSAAPPAIRALLEPARQIATGKLRVSLERKEAA